MDILDNIKEKKGIRCLVNKQKKLERLERLKMSQESELQFVEFNTDTDGQIKCKNSRCIESMVGNCGYCDEHCTVEDCD